VAAVEINLEELGAVGRERKNGIIGNFDAVIEF